MEYLVSSGTDLVVSSLALVMSFGCLAVHIVTPKARVEFVSLPMPLGKTVFSEGGMTTEVTIYGTVESLKSLFVERGYER